MGPVQCAAMVRSYGQEGRGLTSLSDLPPDINAMRFRSIPLQSNQSSNQWPSCVRLLAVPRSSHHLVWLVGRQHDALHDANSRVPHLISHNFESAIHFLQASGVRAQSTRHDDHGLRGLIQVRDPWQHAVGRASKGQGTGRPSAT